jgi:threonine dehydrogenase-like Zn-dependent dehydrogenase
VTAVADPDPSDRALIALEQVGVCGTDVKILTGGIPVRYPRILGHELVGSVLRPSARGLVPEGTRVLVDPTITCGHCDLCRRDRAALCRNGALMGRDVDGGFADYVAVDEGQLHPIPDTIGPQDAALLQVLGTCVHGQTLVEVFPGQTALVVGLGVSGLLHVQLLRARGVREIIGVTRSEEKRRLAKRLGASALAHPDQAAQVVAEVTGGHGPDLVVESAGTVATLAQAIELAGIAATVLVFGTITETEGRLPFYQLYYKELTVVNARSAQPRDYARAVQLAGDAMLDLAPLLSATYPLEQAAEAFDAFRTGDLLKVTLEVA